MAGNSRIWRDSNTVPVSDIIEFNIGAAPDTTGHIQQTSIELVSAFGENPKPKGQLDEIQDTGFKSLTFQISGFIENPTNSLLPDDVKVWMLEDKTTGTYIHGRFGIELDDFPWFDIHPNGNRGCMLLSWTWIRAGETRGKAEFTAMVRFNANVTGLNASTYAWDVA